ncbi:MAG: 3-deoxy-8-phosphooctulonate synthase [Bacteroidales bacterium]|nr:3-deoxy-8-phosphooctulonate synthase [Bacteroidales bacterium]
MNRPVIPALSDLIPGIQFPESRNFFLIAGPCVVENRDLVMKVAETISRLSEKYELPFIFKSSYRKANRSRLDSFTGIGDEKALKILAEVKREFGVPVITDIHLPEEAKMAAEFVDVIQIPAFLCRQTDILLAAANTGKTVSVKKGQFVAPSAMKFVIDKIRSTGNRKVMVTERGTTFGYGDLVVDFRSIPEMQTFGVPVVLDVTHSLQQPNQESGISGGRPGFIETLARAGIAAGADGIFLETHPEPATALSDGSNMLRLDLLDELIKKLIKIRQVINNM